MFFIKAREVFNGSALDDKLSSSTAIITITVQDVNDEPPVFNKRDYFILIPENIAPGTPLPNLNMSVTDSDIVRTYLIFVKRFSIHFQVFQYIFFPRVQIQNFRCGCTTSQNCL